MKVCSSPCEHSIDAQVKAGKTVEEAEKLFDGATGRLIAKGFQNRGGLALVATAQLSHYNEIYLLPVRLQTQNMLDDIRDYRKQLVAALGEDPHVDYMNNT